MDAKQWLERGILLDMEIDVLKRAQQRAWDDAVNLSIPLHEDLVKQHAGKNSNEHKFVNYAAYGLWVKQKLEELYRVKLEIQQAIARVDEPVYRALLLERYVLGNKWEVIAQHLSYELRWVYKLHKKALGAFAQIHNGTSKDTTVV